MTTTSPRGSENGNRYSPSGFEMLTRSGIMIDVRNPRPEDIRLEDIAVGLASEMRFAGHCPLQPTVAEHSVAVEWLAGVLLQDVPTDVLEDRTALEQECRQAALLHDAAEAYVGDVTGAVKLHLRSQARRADGRRHSPYDHIEARWELVICEALTGKHDLVTRWGDLVHEADTLACAYEMAWGGWCPAAHPPEWVAKAQPMAQAYAALREDDGGRAAFLRRAAFLGLS